MRTDYTVLRVTHDGPIAEVVLNRGDKLNTMTPDFFDEIKQVFREIDHHPEIRVAILWAEGRHFTAGLDLHAAAPNILGGGGEDSAAAKADKLYRAVIDWQQAISAPQECRKPVIAAVHGHCIGGGVDLTTACDIRLCTQDATFSIHETKIAIVADIGTLQRISAITGPGIAREMAYTGKRLGAERALQCGLVNAVYADQAALLAGAREMAAEIAANSPLAVQGTKVVLNYSEQHSLEDGLHFVAQWNAARLHSADLAEAITAFMEKRPPKFTGK